MRSADLDGLASLVADRGGIDVQRFLQAGGGLESWIEGIRTMRHRMA